MALEFGYFSLSDNNYPGEGQRTSSETVLQVRDQAIYADKIGMHSAWIGEHHFDTLGVNSCPELLLASIAPVTKRIRLAPAITVMPLHHPLRVAEQWATLDLVSGGRVDFATGRGYDVREYAPFGTPYKESAELMEEGIDVVLKAWTSPGKWSHDGFYYTIPEMEITPKPVQQPIPFYVACFSMTSMEMLAKRGLNVIFAPFAANLMFGGLDKAVDTYHETCTRFGTTPGDAKCSYFIHIAETPEEDSIGRGAVIRYIRNCIIGAFPNDPAKMPPTMMYFLEINKMLETMEESTLSERSILLGPPEEIIKSLKKVEAAGIGEVILYFNLGNKPASMVKEQMDRFMRDVAPAFEGSHIAAVA